MPEFNVHPTIMESIKAALFCDYLNEDSLVNKLEAGKESTMLPIYHYINEYKRDDQTFTFRTVTTYFKNAEEEKSYFRSLTEKRPVNGIFAIVTGNYIPRLLIERAAKKDIHFRLTVVRNDELKAMGMDIYKKVLENNFAIASASYTSFYKFPSYGDLFGLDPLGLHMNYEVKSAKRGQEVPRFSAHSYYSEGDDFFFTTYNALDALKIRELGRPMGARFVIAEFTSDVLDNVKYDGYNFMSERLAKALGFIGVRGNGRLVCKRGVIKGDWMVVPDENLKGADLVYHTENLKVKELTATGEWVIITIENHDPLHQASYDVQSISNNPVVLSQNGHIDAAVSMIKEIEDIVVTGELPEWMELGEEAHDEGLGQIKMEQLSELMKRGHMRWQLAGFELTDSQNFMYMGVTGGIKKMEGGKVNGFYARTFVPMVNACSVGVLTHSALVNMGGVELPEVDHVVWTKWGAVFPDERFEATFDLHGTWDGDDNAKFQLVKIYCDDADVLENLRQDSVIDRRHVVPVAASDAVEATVVIRSPNGPGEYSIEFVGEDFPFFGTGALEVINLVDLPRGQNHMLTLINKKGLPIDLTVYGGTMTADQAVYMIEAQLENPGIGGVANAMMCWVDVMGVGFPSVMTDVFGGMVDAVQQGFCKEQLEAVRLESGVVFSQLLDAMSQDPTLTIDYDLFMTRVPARLRGEFDPTQVVAKRMTHFNLMYSMSIKALREVAQTKSMETRNASRLAEIIRGINVPKAVMAQVRAFVQYHESNLRAIDSQYDSRKDTNPFVKLMKNHLKVEAIKNEVGLMVEEINAITDHHDHFVAGLYKYMITPTTKKPLGGWDRIIFQQGRDIAVMDLLIEVLQRRGKI